MRTALYRHWDSNGRLLYVGISLSAVSRLAQHKSTSGWYDQIASVTVEYFETREEALRAETAAIRSEGPAHNKAKTKMRRLDGYKLPDPPKEISLYVVRRSGTNEFHGFVWGRSRKDIWLAFDEFGDPYGFEFSKVGTPGALVHKTCGLEIAQLDEIEDDATEDEVGISFGAFGLSERADNLLRRMSEARWESFKEVGPLFYPANDNEPMRQAA